MKHFLLALLVFIFAPHIIHAAANYPIEIASNHIVNTDNDDSITILNNPVRDGYLKIRLDHITSPSVTISLINSIGNEVLVTTHNTSKSIINIDVSELSSGVYFLRVQTGTTNLSKKLIIQ